MPYSSTKQLPPAAKNLPTGAKKIWLAAFNASFKKYGEQKAFAIAMAAVKNKYKQVSGKWVLKDDDIADEKLPIEFKTMPAAAKSIFRAAYRVALREEPEDLAAILALNAVKKKFVREEGEDGEEWVEIKAKQPDEDEEGEGGEEGNGEGSEGDDDTDENKKRKASEGGEGEGGEYTRTTKTTETTEMRRGGNSEGAADSMELIETFTLDADSAKNYGMHITPSGYLVAEPRIARTGIQIYKGFELGLPNVDEIRVYRPETEVFDKRAMSSLAHRPITLDHPDTSIDPTNWKKFAVGHSTGDIARDGEFIRVPLVLMDQAAIDAVRSGKSQLSVGYGAKLKWEAGETSDGQYYDAMQTEIRANHIALVRAARGGDKLRMGDSHERRKPMTERTLNLDGVNIALEDKDGQILERHLKVLNDTVADVRKQLGDGQTQIGALSAQVAELTKTIATKDGEIAVLNKKIEDGKVTPQQLDEFCRQRMDVVGRAVQVLGDKYTFDNKPDTVIRRDVVASYMGDQAAKDMSDEGILGAFNVITKQQTADSNTRLAMSFSRPLNNSTVNDAAAKAYDKRNEELQNAWKSNKRQRASA